MEEILALISQSAALSTASNLLIGGASLVVCVFALGDALEYVKDFFETVRGGISVRAEYLEFISKKSIEIPGFFAAFASRHTVIVTVSGLFVTISFNMANIIANFGPSTDLFYTRLALYVLIAALVFTIIWRLVELYLVAGFILRRGRRD